MKTGAMVLGIIGGIIAFLMGLLLFGLGQLGSELEVEGSGIVQVLSLAIPVVALVGASIVKSKTLIGGLLMLASAIAMVVVLGINFFSLLPGIPLLIGGTLGLISSKETALA